jgi:uncharacterized membrane protein
MNEKILYAGDTSLDTAAGYLAGILTSSGLDFDYLPSNRPIRLATRNRRYALYIISDYPVNNWRAEDFDIVAEAVSAGAGLIMLGGWESFHGQAGQYSESPLAEALPVEMRHSDDRVNSSQPWLIEPHLSHPIVDPLPFAENPTYVGGFNRISPKVEALEVLSLRQMRISSSQPGMYELRPGRSEPLLVLGSFGRGRTAAFASDVAPHWVGGFVDWGRNRLKAQAPGAAEIEVGGDYAEFFVRLVRWASGRSLQS